MVAASTEDSAPLGLAVAKLGGNIQLRQPGSGTKSNLQVLPAANGSSNGKLQPNQQSAPSTILHCQTCIQQHNSNTIPAAASKAGITSKIPPGPAQPSNASITSSSKSSTPLDTNRGPTPAITSQVSLTENVSKHSPSKLAVLVPSVHTAAPASPTQASSPNSRQHHLSSTAGRPSVLSHTSPEAKAVNGARRCSPLKHSSTGSCLDGRSSSSSHCSQGGPADANKDDSSNADHALASPRLKQRSLNGAATCAAAASQKTATSAVAALSASLPFVTSPTLQHHRERRRAELYALNIILARSDDLRVAAYLQQQQQQQQQCKLPSCLGAAHTADKPTADAALASVSVNSQSSTDGMNHGV